MKKVLIYLSVVLLGNVMFAQQLPQSSMYMMNNYLLNPAEGGTEDFIDLQAGYRAQWTGLGTEQTGINPNTMYFSGHSPIGKHSVNKDTTRENSAELESAVKPLPYHGVGGMVLSDQAGHFNTLEVKGSYAYHLPVSKEFFLSIGAFAGFKQLSVDAAKIVYDSDDGTDPVSGNEGFQSSMNPDVTLGIWGYHKSFYFGVSSFQLLGNSVNVTTQEVEGGNLNRHYYFTGGGKIDVSQDMFLVPSLLFKMLPGVPMTMDFNAKINYAHKYWGGASFRMGNEAESVVILAGIEVV